MKRFLGARVRMVLACAALLSLMLAVQNSSGQPDDEPPIITRDNFHAKASKVRRLTPAELDKQLEADFAKETKEKETESKAAPRALRKVHAAPAHRLSRDVLLNPEAARSKKKPKEFQITLRNAFIEKYKNRATMTTPFRVVFPAKKIHSAADDGDLHIAGLADEAMLPCVAEIMNAKNFPAAVQLVRGLATSGEVTTVTGAWRLWCEHPDQHPPALPQIQDDVIADYPDSNPNHVFEIHPVSRIGDISVLGSLKTIPGYEPWDADTAFTVYENLPCRIVPDPETQTTTIFTKKVGYNYVQFRLRLDEDDQFITMGGRIVRCSVLTLGGTEVAKNRRMVFVLNSAPEQQVRTLKKGETMDVLGIPRIDLALVSWRARNADANPDALTWNLPYEVLVVGVLKEEQARTPRRPRDRTFAAGFNQWLQASRYEYQDDIVPHLPPSASEDLSLPPLPAGLNRDRARQLPGLMLTRQFGRIVDGHRRDTFKGCGNREKAV